MEPQAAREITAAELLAALDQRLAWIRTKHVPVALSQGQMRRRARKLRRWHLGEPPGKRIPSSDIRVNIRLSKHALTELEAFMARFGFRSRHAAIEWLIASRPEWTYEPELEE